MRPPLPTPATLMRYGLTGEEWLTLAGEECFVCERPWDESRRAVIDHEHVRGWKKMPPHERRKYVRGVTCISCNHYILTRWGSARRHDRAAAYLRRYARGDTQWTL